MGFRISTEVGRLGLPMVWAEIVVAALARNLIAALGAGMLTLWLLLWLF